MDKIFRRGQNQKRWIKAAEMDKTGSSDTNRIDG